MDSTLRFSNRVQDYHQHRPGYPLEIIAILKREKTLPTDAIVADVGSGTGKLTEIFFKHVRTIYGVEPNEEMRRQAEKDFEDVINFVSVAASAESTTLPSTSIDLVTAGQSFHWFDLEKSYAEFKRILKSNSFVALVWNYRDIDFDDLQREYEEILKADIPNYKQLDHKTISDEKIFNFYRSSRVKKFTLHNFQYFTLDSLKGRVLSSSYVPKPPNPTTAHILEQVEQLFHKFQRTGQIKFIYKTILYLGQLH